MRHYQMTRAVDGVIDVEGQLSYAIDDTRLPAAADITEAMAPHQPQDPFLRKLR